MKKAKKLIPYLSALSLSCATAGAWTLVDDFESYNNDGSQIPYTMNTVSSEAVQYLFEGVDDDADNTVYHLYTGDLGVGWADTHITIPMPDGISIGAGQVATLYWRAYEVGIDNNWHVGVTDLDEVSTWNHNSVIIKVTETSQVTVHSGGYAGSDPAYIADTGAWYHYWMVVNYDSATYNLWVQGPNDASPVQITIASGATKDFNFRRQPEDVIDHISIASNSEAPAASNAGEFWYLDDFYITMGEEICIPGEDCGTASDLTWGGINANAQGWVDTGSWLGWLNVKADTDWAWSDSLQQWTYAQDPGADAEGAWIYVINN